MYLELIDIDTKESLDYDMFYETFNETGGLKPCKGDRIEDADNHIYLVIDVLYHRNDFHKPCIKYTLKNTGEIGEPSMIQKIHNIIGDNRIRVRGIKSPYITEDREERFYDYYDLCWMHSNYYGTSPKRYEYYLHFNTKRYSGYFQSLSYKLQKEIFELVSKGCYEILS